MLVLGHKPIKNKKRFKFFQVVAPLGVTECQATHGPRYWEITLHDKIDHRDARATTNPMGVTFVCIPSKTAPPNPHEVACRAAGELNEARGFIMARYIYKGLPVLGVLWASNGTFVFPLKSTDPDRVRPIAPELRRALECGGRVPQWAIETIRHYSKK